MCTAARTGNRLLCTEMTKLIGGSMTENFLTGSVTHMDAIFGWAAGIAEMLLQSYNGEIVLLPCLPDEWRHGKTRECERVADLRSQCRGKTGSMYQHPSFLL
jgi:alpha-L-fucosidase 2